MVQVKQIQGLISLLRFSYDFIFISTETNGQGKTFDRAATIDKLYFKPVNEVTGIPQGVTVANSVTLNVYNDAGALIGSAAGNITVVGGGALVVVNIVPAISVSAGANAVIKPTLAIGTGLKLEAGFSGNNV